MKQTRNWKDYEPQAKRAAHFISARARREGLMVSPDDALQELAIMWMDCCREWREDGGASFKTYFYQALKMSYGRVIRNVCGRNARTVAYNTKSIDSVSFDMEGEEFGLHEVVPDENMGNPERDMIRNQGTEKILERNPLFRKLLALCVNPTPELHAQLKALHAKHEYAKQIGHPIKSAEPTGLTPIMLRQVFGFDKNWRQRKLTQLI